LCGRKRDTKAQGVSFMPQRYFVNFMIFMPRIFPAFQIVQEISGTFRPSAGNIYALRISRVMGAVPVQSDLPGGSPSYFHSTNKVMKNFEIFN
jgi:hypothetical protein